MMNFEVLPRLLRFNMRYSIFCFLSERGTDIAPAKSSKVGAGSANRASKIRQGRESGDLRGNAGLRPSVSRVPLLVVLGFLAAVGVARMSMEMEQGVAIDFYQFWAVGGAAEVTPGENIYELATGERLARALLERAEEIESPARRAAARFRAQRIDVVSTPFFYSFFRAARTGDYDADLRRHRLLSLAAFVLATLLTGYVVGCAPAVTLAALAFFLLAFPPLRFDLIEGNVNSMQFAILAIALWLRCDPDRAWRAVAAGCVLSLAVFFKPNLAMVAALLVLGWGFLGRKLDILRAALGAAAGALIAAAASACLFGATASWRSWIGAMSNLERDFAVGIAQGNMGGARLIGDVLGRDPTVLLLIVLVGITAHRLWVLRRAIGGAPAGIALVRDVDSLLIALGPAVAILGTAIAWPHYAILCAPLFLVCLHRLEAETSLASVNGLLVIAALAGFSSIFWLDAAGLQAPLAQVLALALGILALYAAGVTALAPQKLHK